ncbi:hypothetical protein PMI06_008486 [Burkholderia sp. BT03]|nr:hypothetical protein PMI06_008486 [Burkholderia sp. BT03]SKC48297.1 hypothetical protein SAMN06266956_0208 [Paraburkholderia hospita]
MQGQVQAAETHNRRTSPVKTGSLAAYHSTVRRAIGKSKLGFLKMNKGPKPH